MLSESEKLRLSQLVRCEGKRNSFPIEERCHLWQSVGDARRECAGRFYPLCGGKRRWYPCRTRYPLGR